MDKILQLKIVIEDSRPVIWRRLLVSSEITFYELHYVIQLAFGWDTSHMHEFEVEGHEEKGYILEEEEEEEEELLEDLSLGSVLIKGQKFNYTYDFGDDWKHKIKVEKIIPKEEIKVYPNCLGGEMRGPLEDSGGIFGYQRLIEILKDTNHDEYEDYIEWVEDDFDPKHFDLKKLNDRFMKFDELFSCED